MPPVKHGLHRVVEFAGLVGEMVQDVHGVDVKKGHEKIAEIGPDVLQQGRHVAQGAGPQGHVEIGLEEEAPDPVQVVGAGTGPEGPGVLQGADHVADEPVGGGGPGGDPHGVVAAHVPQVQFLLGLHVVGGDAGSPGNLHQALGIAAVAAPHHHQGLGLAGQCPDLAWRQAVASQMVLRISAPGKRALMSCTSSSNWSSLWVVWATTMSWSSSGRAATSSGVDTT